MLNLVRSLSRGDAVLKRLESITRRLLELIGIDFGCAFLAGEGRGIMAGAFTENKEVRQRVPPQTVRAVEPGAALACGEQAGHGGHLGIAIHLDAAHHVVGSWPHLHWVLGNIDVGKLLKLVIHAGELSLDMLGGVRQPLLDPGDVEKDTAVGTAPTLADLADYAASDVVAGQQFRGPSSVLIALSVAPALFFGSGG